MAGRVRDLGLDCVALPSALRTLRWIERRELGARSPMPVQCARRCRDLVLVQHCLLSIIGGRDRDKRVAFARSYPITILVRGPSRRNRCSMDDLVMETQPAVGPKLSRARCRNTALPRPAVRGVVL